jgi:hypothetical protein
MLKYIASGSLVMQIKESEIANEVRTMVVGDRLLRKMKTDISKKFVISVVVAMQKVTAPRIGISQSALTSYLKRK